MSESCLPERQRMDKSVDGEGERERETERARERESERGSH